MAGDARSNFQNRVGGFVALFGRSQILSCMVADLRVLAKALETRKTPKMFFGGR